ncbi:hypothetical protein VPH5P1C_0268 [Vibrio phage 5P1c]
MLILGGSIIHVIDYLFVMYLWMWYNESIP